MLAHSHSRLTLFSAAREWIAHLLYFCVSQSCYLTNRIAWGFSYRCPMPLLKGFFTLILFSLFFTSMKVMLGLLASWQQSRTHKERDCLNRPVKMCVQDRRSSISCMVGRLFFFAPHSQIKFPTTHNGEASIWHAATKFTHSISKKKKKVYI